MTTEPVRVFSVVVGVALLALPHLHTFGLPITAQQVEALETFLPSVLVLLGGEVVRSRVSPVAKP